MITALAVVMHILVCPQTTLNVTASDDNLDAFRSARCTRSELFLDPDQTVIVHARAAL